VFSLSAAQDEQFRGTIIVEHFVILKKARSRLKIIALKY
jgi:hypothetical protein